MNCKCEGLGRRRGSAMLHDGFLLRSGVRVKTRYGYKIVVKDYIIKLMTRY